VYFPDAASDAPFKENVHIRVKSKCDRSPPKISANFTLATSSIAWPASLCWATRVQEEHELFSKDKQEASDIETVLSMLSSPGSIAMRMQNVCAASI
jgi:hypothetical protein